MTIRKDCDGGVWREGACLNQGSRGFEAALDGDEFCLEDCLGVAERYVTRAEEGSFIHDNIPSTSAPSVSVVYFGTIRVNAYICVMMCVVFNSVCYFDVKDDMVRGFGDCI